MRSNIEENAQKNKPFLLKPAGKDYLWGGSRLNDDFSKGIDLNPLAETWECSTHPDGPSTVASGEYAGQTLAAVLKAHPKYLGTHPGTKGELPILIKFIDARKDLSVQVHPTDEYAREHENGQLGKTEMWYVLDASKDAKLVYGLHHDVDKEQLRKSIEDGTVEKYLQKVPVKKNDLFYIEAGTIHAIGAGALIAEIQESSNLTYRLYDYDRTDKNGRKRQLHIEKALEAANLKASAEPRQPLRVLKYRRGCASELLCRCRYFEVYRMLVNTERCRELVGYQADSSSFRVLLCTDGCGSISFGENEAFNFFRGDCIFVPADSVKLRIHGQAQFLDVRG
ncbi:MAG TPA: class I mannose-6-phosphate isomerase [Candidatus Eisenbergiella merdipullorum]|uniref:Class I mannose-6-phosphate isomerase n=1 Tax=Candidatus Eisenbergiella merdipullorum TaxID=2838553 RepID=A0A9D2L0G0_9FIRM|nr:class I mannose-6-phosphate isomerase [Candidatus Eisenbergiella merdipullorum]